MRPTLLSIVLFLLTFNLFSQSYLNEIAMGTCKCVENIEPGLGQKTMSLAYGKCMVQQAQLFKEQLMRDLNIDVENLNEAMGKQLGTKVGALMAKQCPDIFRTFVENMQQNTNTTPDEMLYLKGKITQVHSGDFVQFSLEDAVGKSHRFLWLGPVESNIAIEADFELLKDMQVFVQYELKSIFDGKSKSYIEVKVLKHIEKF